MTGTAQSPTAQRAADARPLLDAAATVRSGPGWIQDLRQQALDALREQGLPSPRLPGWSVDLRPLATTTVTTGRARAHPVAARDVEALGFAGEGIRLVFVDGLLEPSLCKVDAVPDGIRLGGLSQAWRDPVVEDNLGRHADSDDPTVLLNTAFCQDGAVIAAEPDAVVEEPIHVLYLGGGDHAEPLVTAPRTLVLAAKGAEVPLVECHASLGTGPTASFAVTEVSAAPGAKVSHVRVQRQGLRDWHVGAVHARIDRDASFRSLTMNFGADVARVDVTARLAAPGADCSLDGLFLGARDQRQTCMTRVEHQMPHATSRQLYKGILDGAARGAFYGSVLVRADAQKTNAEQQNRNLLLSRKALVDSTPQLEIHADDVKCSHGSTIGHLREDALFFLRSRGLDPERARLLLTLAFAREVLEREPHEGVRAMLDGLLASWFAGRNDVTTAGDAPAAPDLAGRAA